jgi:hypothetical protein
MTTPGSHLLIHHVIVKLPGITKGQINKSLVVPMGLGSANSWGRSDCCASQSAMVVEHSTQLGTMLCEIDTL